MVLTRHTSVENGIWSKSLKESMGTYSTYFILLDDRIIIIQLGLNWHKLDSSKKLGMVT